MIVLAIILCFRSPTKTHVEKRLRAEFLRSHLHCLLARVGPYADDESSAPSAIESSSTLNAEEIAMRLHDLEQECIRQSEGTQPLSPTRGVSPRDADAYLYERVGEQMGLVDSHSQGYFHQTSTRMRRSYLNSARVVVGVTFLAAMVGAYRVYFTTSMPVLTYFLFAFCGSLAVLVVALRSVFGWDSKASLYIRQADQLQSIVEDLRSARDSIGEDGKPAMLRFRQHAAKFEALMAREACDWKLISEREYFDVTF